jgi:hypothetical protein
MKTENLRRMRTVRFVATGTVLIALALGVSLVAKAGQKNMYPLSIFRTPTNIFASGALGSVRADGTTNDMGCYVGVVSRNPADPTVGGLPVLWCSAVNGVDVAVCTSTDAGLIKIASMIGTDSYITFVVRQNLKNVLDPMNGRCTSLEVQTYSEMEPKVP